MKKLNLAPYQVRRYETPYGSGWLVKNTETGKEIEYYDDEEDYYEDDSWDVEDEEGEEEGEEEEEAAEEEVE